MGFSNKMETKSNNSFNVTIVAPELNQGMNVNFCTYPKVTAFFILVRYQQALLAKALSHLFVPHLNDNCYSSSMGFKNFIKQDSYLKSATP